VLCFGQPKHAGPLPTSDERAVQESPTHLRNAPPEKREMVAKHRFCFSGGGVT